MHHRPLNHEKSKKAVLDEKLEENTTLPLILKHSNQDVLLAKAIPPPLHAEGQEF